MFSSPCSLLSAPCSALIALAAAAGISRFETATLKTEALQPAPQVAAPTLNPFGVARYVLPASSFDLTANHWGRSAPAASAHDLRGEGTAAPAFALAPEPSSPPPPLMAIATRTFFRPDAAAPAPRPHSHPYAVGPPARESRPPRRAAGTEVPGDSSARRSQLSRIARVSPAHFSIGAHVIRTADAGLNPGASFPPPGFAPRAGREPAESGKPADRSSLVARVEILP